MKASANVEIKVDRKTVTAYLSGEIDHHNAPELRRKIDEAVNNRLPELLVLDFGAVNFMDSSGIGLVMGRYRLIEGLNCKMYIINLSGHAYKVMRLAGLGKIAVRLKKNPVLQSRRLKSSGKTLSESRRSASLQKNSTPTVMRLHSLSIFRHLRCR